MTLIPSGQKLVDFLFNSLKFQFIILVFTVKHIKEYKSGFSDEWRGRKLSSTGQEEMMLR